MRPTPDAPMAGEGPPPGADMPPIAGNASIDVCCCSREAIGAELGGGPIGLRFCGSNLFCCTNACYMYDFDNLEIFKKYYVYTIAVSQKEQTTHFTKKSTLVMKFIHVDKLIWEGPNEYLAAI